MYVSVNKIIANPKIIPQIIGHNDVGGVPSSLFIIDIINHPVPYIPNPIKSEVKKLPIIWLVI